jgi:hypothetical protein
MATTGSRLLPNTKDLTMPALMETALHDRAPGYLEALCEKLLGEGIVAPSDLLLTSKIAMETKLAAHQNFNFREMADTISLRDYIDPDPTPMQPAEPARPASTFSRQSRRSPERRQRSRSNDFRGRGRNRSFSDGHPGRRENSRPHRGGQNRQQRKDNGPPPPKPELWTAVERGDLREVQKLLDSGSDPMEKFQGWTPLMKAAEEGHVDIIQLLLNRGVDIEAANNKGRTALSFAAAPSMKDTERRETPVAAIRLLLSSGADPKHKCSRNRTPRDYAVDAKRDEAVKVFDEPL